MVPPGAARAAPSWLVAPTGCPRGLIRRVPRRRGLSRQRGAPGACSGVCRAVVVARAVPRAPSASGVPRAARCRLPVSSWLVAQFPAPLAVHVRGWGQGPLRECLLELCVHRPSARLGGWMHSSAGTHPDRPLPARPRLREDIGRAPCPPPHGGSAGGGGEEVLPAAKCARPPGADTYEPVCTFPRRRFRSAPDPTDKGHAHQGREELREQPTTGRWTATHRTGLGGPRKGRGELREQPRRDPQTAARSAGQDGSRTQQAPGAPRRHPVGRTR
ncbi:hypothetical protein SAMN05216267_105614 [Actinacidiphila rubida]|uniref:Uncharacterized protein n=1 Tax=Actinacidiphila rubida TaxID=310780 RepID=A0A1H8TPC8_9ACTN|nr:hypothetical protein SAMN05216267_105614 [Actinacidiphila rubida]